MLKVGFDFGVEHAICGELSLQQSRGNALSLERVGQWAQRVAQAQLKGGSLARGSQALL